MANETIKEVSEETQKILPVISKNLLATLLVFMCCATGFIIYKIDWNLVVLSNIKSEIKQSDLKPKEKKEAIESADRLIRINAE